MKKKIKFFLSVFVMAALAGVMWRQSHLTYQQYSRNLTQMSSEDSEAETVTEFPDTYEEKVSDQFSIRADIITGADFQQDQLVEATAELYLPDSDTWTETMLLEQKDAYEYTEQETVSVRGIQGNCYAWDKIDSDYLYLDGESIFYWKQPEMNCISALWHFDDVDPMYNWDAFHQISELNEFSIADAWSKARNQLQQTGVETESLEYEEAIAADAKRLSEQQELLQKSNDITDTDITMDYSEKEEGYYFWCYQTWKHLMIYPEVSVSEYLLQNPYISMYVTRDGIYEIDIPVIFKISETESPVQLCSFDGIVKTLINHYDKVDMDRELVVTECRLVEYPLSVADNTYQLIPIWLCVAEQNMGEDASNTQKYILAINAVTGEEMTELE